MPRNSLPFLHTSFISYEWSRNVHKSTQWRSLPPPRPYCNFCSNSPSEQCYVSVYTRRSCYYCSVIASCVNPARSCSLNRWRVWQKEAAHTHCQRLWVVTLQWSRTRRISETKTIIEEDRGLCVCVCVHPHTHTHTQTYIKGSFGK